MELRESSGRVAEVTLSEITFVFLMLVETTLHAEEKLLVRTMFKVDFGADPRREFLDVASVGSAIISTDVVPQIKQNVPLWTELPRESDCMGQELTGVEKLEVGMAGEKVLRERSAVRQFIPEFRVLGVDWIHLLVG